MSNMNVPPELVLGEGRLPGFQKPAMCYILTWPREEALVSPPLLRRTLIALWELHLHDLI